MLFAALYGIKRAKRDLGYFPVRLGFLILSPVLLSWKIPSYLILLEVFQQTEKKNQHNPKPQKTPQYTTTTTKNKQPQHHWTLHYTMELLAWLWSLDSLPKQTL